MREERGLQAINVFLKSIRASAAVCSESEARGDFSLIRDRCKHPRFAWFVLLVNRRVQCKRL